MKKFAVALPLLSVLLIGFSIFAPAAQATVPANIAKALEKCQELDRLSAAQLAKVALKNHTTVATIHSECYTLRHIHQVEQNPDFALAACHRYDRMSNSQLDVVAREGHATVARIRHACYVLENPGYGGGSSSTGSDSGDDSGATSNEPAPDCQCGAFQVCVSSFSKWLCVDKQSNENTCQSNFDCKGTFSNCVSGQCT